MKRKPKCLFPTMKRKPKCLFSTMKRTACRLFPLLIVLLLAGGCGGPKSGDKLFIPEHYQAVLKKLNVTELAALPYFTEPFGVVAKDSGDKETLIVFHKDGTHRQVPLPVTFETILKIYADAGFHLLLQGKVQDIYLIEKKGELYYGASRFDIPGFRPPGSDYRVLTLDGKEAKPYP